MAISHPIPKGETLKAVKYKFNMYVHKYVS